MAAFNLVTDPHTFNGEDNKSCVFFFSQWKTFSRMLICIHRISLRSSCLSTKYFQDIQMETTLTMFRPAALAVCKSCVTKLQMFEKYISARTFLAHKCAKNRVTVNNLVLKWYTRYTRDKKNILKNDSLSTFSSAKKSFPLSPPVPKSASRAEVYVKVSVKEISFGYQVIRWGFSCSKLVRAGIVIEYRLATIYLWLPKITSCHSYFYQVSKNSTS